MTIDVKYMGHLRTQCTHKRSDSKLNTDAPVDNKGKGETFSPTDLMATSLASCMITVMAIRANELNIAFQNVEAEVEKIMASAPRRIKEVNITLKVKHLWSDEEKKIMEEKAANCPVALSMHSDVKQGLKFLYLSN